MDKTIEQQARELLAEAIDRPPQFIDAMGDGFCFTKDESLRAIARALTRPAPSDEEVEAAAKRMHEAERQGGYANDWDWHEVGATYRDHYLRMARAALGGW